MKVTSGASVVYKTQETSGIIVELTIKLVTTRWRT